MIFFFPYFPFSFSPFLSFNHNVKERERLKIKTYGLKLHYFVPLHRVYMVNNFECFLSLPSLVLCLPLTEGDTCMLGCMCVHEHTRGCLVPSRIC